MVSIGCFVSFLNLFQWSMSDYVSCDSHLLRSLSLHISFTAQSDPPLASSNLLLPFYLSSVKPNWSSTRILLLYHRCYCSDIRSTASFNLLIPFTSSSFHNFHFHDKNRCNSPPPSIYTPPLTTIITIYVVGHHHHHLVHLREPCSIFFIHHKSDHPRYLAPIQVFAFEVSFLPSSFLLMCLCDSGKFYFRLGFEKNYSFEFWTFGVSYVRWWAHQMSIRF